MSAGNAEETNPSLIRRIKQSGNQSAWAEFDAMYRPILIRYAKGQGLRDADVEDVVQHCMTAIYMHIDGFTYDPHRGRFKSWLRTLVNNRCRDLLKMRRGATVDEGFLESVPSQGQSPEDAFDQIWVDEHFNHCLRRVKKEIDASEFEAFEQYVLHARPVHEVCKELNVEPSKLYKIKHRLTGKLRDMMTTLVGRDFDGARTSRAARLRSDG